MSAKYDTIVIGSGHNGLTCACYLAKAGLKVLVLEQYIPSIAEQAATLQSVSGGLDQYRFQLQTPRSWWDEMFEAEETKALFGSWDLHVG